MKHHEGDEEHEGENSENKTLNAILQFRGAEMDQSSKLHTGQIHVSQKLRFTKSIFRALRLLRGDFFR